MAGAALSVVIPSRNRPARLERCLATLGDELLPDDELIVVDSASTGDGTAAVATTAGARVLREALPGASRARNTGWRAATNDVVCFVDDDVTVTEGWRAAIVEAFGNDPELAFLSGRSLPPPHQRDVAHPVAVVDVDGPHRIDVDSVGVLGATANLAIRRAVLEAVAGFDERLGPGAAIPAAEDLDLIDRVVESGRFGRYAPDAVVYHEQWRTRGERLRLDWGYGVGQGVRLVSIRRRDPARSRRIARDVVVGSDLAAVTSSLRDRYLGGVVFALTRLVAMLYGAVVVSHRLRRPT